MIVAREGRLSPLRSGSADTLPYRASAFGGPTLPLAWLDDPSAPVVVQLELDEPLDEVYEVSPDGTLIATWVEGTAMDPNRFDVLDIRTGEVVASVEDTTPSQMIDLIWSPDSRSFRFNSGSSAVLHRLGGQTFRTDDVRRARSVGFASGPAATEWIRCSPRLERYLVTDQSGDGEADVDESCVSMGQMVDRDGEWLVLGARSPGEIPPSGAQLVAVRAGEEAKDLNVAAGIDGDDSFGYDVRGCGPFGIVTNVNYDGGQTYLFDSSTDRLVPAAGLQADECPVGSSDGDRVAYASSEGPVNVLTISSGTVVEVARSGRPIAFGRDGMQVLVDGGGTFRTSVDGSGGQEASVQATPTSGLSRSYCRVGDTGEVVILTNAGLVVYDVTEDTSFDVVGFGIPDSCSLSAEGSWFLAGPVLIDTQHQNSWLLPAIGMPDGTPERLDDFAPGRVADYRFADRLPPIPGMPAH
ncbi:hypothetical protein [uncultured Serinicoccus sp.]|uniref:hypothetical protein n=1 Tax=uncultured Serinicoccus sp. TaxID=735514 RepID=UPI00261C2DC1|nr:hypothetical protein [uncultured Serinicoccus sp.]